MCNPWLFSPSCLSRNHLCSTLMVSRLDTYTVSINSKPVLALRCMSKLSSILTFTASLWPHTRLEPSHLKTVFPASILPYSILHKSTALQWDMLFPYRTLQGLNGF